MVTGSVIVGSGDKGEIVWGPVPIANVIVSAPAFVFASRIACRSEPAPESFVLVTLYVARIAACEFLRDDRPDALSPIGAAPTDRPVTCGGAVRSWA